MLRARKPSTSPWRNVLSLLGTCRQIAHEATPIAYTTCVFEHDYAAWPTLLIGRENCKLIQFMTTGQAILRPIAYRLKNKTGIDPLPSLRRITFQCRYPYRLADFNKKVVVLRSFFSRADLEVVFQGPGGEELFRR